MKIKQQWNLLDLLKTVLWEKFIALSDYIKNQKEHRWMTQWSNSRFGNIRTNQIQTQTMARNNKFQSKVNEMETSKQKTVKGSMKRRANSWDDKQYRQFLGPYNQKKSIEPNYQNQKWTEKHANRHHRNGEFPKRTL